MNAKEFYEVKYSNYNYSYYAFFEQYDAICFNLVKSRRVGHISKNLLAFLSMFNYGIASEDKRTQFLNEIYDLQLQIENDTQYKRIFDDVERLRSSGRVDIKLEMQYYKAYYNYFFKLMKTFGAISTQLSYTFMPTVFGTQPKFKYYNSEPFYKSMTKIQEHVSVNVSNFSLSNFAKAFNSVIVYYYGYHRYVDNASKEKIEACISNIISTFLSSESSRALITQNPVKIDKITKQIYTIMNETIKTTNLAFSVMGLLPKMRQRVYIDTTLI